uniref:Transmembrane protein n=1 Tax=Schistocephalus solidus TaxID=70667 RepID=A0A0V0J6G1_SCHSO
MACAAAFYQRTRRYWRVLAFQNGNLKVLSIPAAVLILCTFSSCSRTGKKHRGGFVGSGSDANSANSGPLADKFHFPRATPLKLRLATVHLVELACLPLYSELVWLLDFSICALFVFFINEIVLGLRQISISVYNATVNGHNSGGASGFFLVHSFFSPSTINVSLVWCAFLVWFSLAALFSTFCIYIHPRSSEANNGEETTERRKNGVNGAGNSNDASSHTEAVSEWPLLLTTAFCSFVAAMFCISMDGRCFDLQLYSAYGNLSFSGGQVASSTLSWGMFQSTLALMAALIGMLFAFPGLQAGRVYLEAIKTSDSILTRVLFHLNFIAPFFCAPTVGIARSLPDFAYPTAVCTNQLTSLRSSVDFFSSYCG